MGMKLIVDYDFDKVVWKSASTKESGSKTFFILNGQVGAQTLKALSLETNEDLSNSLFIFDINNSVTFNKFSYFPCEH